MSKKFYAFMIIIAMGFICGIVPSMISKNFVSDGISLILYGAAIGASIVRVEEDKK